MTTSPTFGFLRLPNFLGFLLISLPPPPAGPGRLTLLDVTGKPPLQLPPDAVHDCSDPLELASPGDDHPPPGRRPDEAAVRAVPGAGRDPGQGRAETGGVVAPVTAVAEQQQVLSVAPPALLAHSLHLGLIIRRSLRGLHLLAAALS